jgi:hypothetical protein
MQDKVVPACGRGGNCHPARMSAKPIRVVIVEDQDLMAAGLGL